VTNNKETRAFDFPGKTSARPIYLRGWLPWKALQGVGVKSWQRKERERKGKRKRKIAK